MKKLQKILLFIIVLSLSLFITSCGKNEGDTVDGRTQGKYKVLSDEKLAEIVSKPETNFTAIVTTIYPLGEKTVQEIKIDGDFNKEKINNLKCSYTENDQTKYLVYLAGDELFEIKEINDEWLATPVEMDKSLFMMFNEIEDFYTVEFLKNHFNEKTGKYYIKGYYINGLKSDIELTIENGHITHMDMDSGRFTKSIDLYDFNTTTVTLPNYHIEYSLPLILCSLSNDVLGGAIDNTNFDNLTLISKTNNNLTVFKYQLDLGLMEKINNDQSALYLNLFGNYLKWDEEITSINEQTFNNEQFDVLKLIKELIKYIDLKYFKLVDYNSNNLDFHIVGSNINTSSFGLITNFEIFIQNHSLKYFNIKTSVQEITIKDFDQTKIEIKDSDNIYFNIIKLLSNKNLANFELIKTINNEEDHYQYDLNNNLIKYNDDYYLINHNRINKLSFKNNEYEILSDYVYDIPFISNVSKLIKYLNNELIINNFEVINNNDNYEIKADGFELIIENNEIVSLNTDNLKIAKENIDFSNIAIMENSNPENIDSFINLVLSSSTFKNYSLLNKSNNEIIKKIDLINKMALKYEKNVKLTINEKTIDCATLETYYFMKDNKYYKHFVIDGYRQETEEIVFDEYVEEMVHNVLDLELIMRSLFNSKTNERTFDLENGNVDIDFNTSVKGTNITGRLVINNFIIEELDYSYIDGGYLTNLGILDINQTIINNPTK